MGDAASCLFSFRGVFKGNQIRFSDWGGDVVLGGVVVPGWLPTVDSEESSLDVIFNVTSVVLSCLELLTQNDHLSDNSLCRDGKNR